MIRVTRGDVDDVLSRTGKLIGECHPRLAGSPGCVRAARAIGEALKPFCDRIDVEEFTQAPGAFFLIGPVLAVTYLVSAVLFFIGGPAIYASAAGLTLGTVYFLAVFARMDRTFDFLFPKRPGANVVGVLEPAAEVRQQVIIGGHHDSAPVCNFLEKHQWAYAFRIIIPVALATLANIGAVLTAAGAWGARAEPMVLPVLKVIVLAGAVFVVPLIRLNRRDASPGAGDNLVSSLMLAKLAALFRSGDPETALRHTRLVLVSTDGEENGQKGALHYTESHRDELRAVKTCVLTLDGLYRLRDLAFLTTETNGMVRLSKSLTEEAVRIASDLGYAVKAGPIPFGGGGTDAGRFARAGVEAASLIAISTRPIRRDIVYHTSRDTVASVEPEVVEAGLNIAANFIREKDKAAD